MLVRGLSLSLSKVILQKGSQVPVFNMVVVFHQEAFPMGFQQPRLRSNQIPLKYLVFFNGSFTQHKAMHVNSLQCGFSKSLCLCF